MSSYSYGKGVQMQSLGQGLAAAASMYATLSMQGQKLEVERTKADNRRLQFEQDKLAGKEAESTEVVKDALEKEEEEKKALAKKTSDDALLSSIGNPSAGNPLGTIDNSYNALSKQGGFGI